MFHYIRALVLSAVLTASIEALGALKGYYSDGQVTPAEWHHVGEMWVNAFLGAALIRRPSDQQKA